MKLTVEQAIHYLEQYELDADCAIVIEPWLGSVSDYSRPFQYSLTKGLFFYLVDATRPGSAARGKYTAMLVIAQKGPLEASLSTAAKKGGA